MDLPSQEQQLLTRLCDSFVSRCKKVIRRVVMVFVMVTAMAFSREHLVKFKLHEPESNRNSFYF